jgi:hypothetical protein
MLLRRPSLRPVLAAAALVLSACGSRLIRIPGPTPYERMSMIDCAADVAGARGFAVTERRVVEGFLLAEGIASEPAASDTAHRLDVLTVAVSRESDVHPVAVQAESFVMRETPAARARGLKRGVRAALGWARPSSRVVELRSAVLDRCAPLTVRRSRAAEN